MPLLRAIARQSGPLYLLLAALTYSLGAGIAKYLGYPPLARELILGLLITLLLQASMDWLAGAFCPPQEKLASEEGAKDHAQFRRAALYAASAGLAAAGALTFAIIRLGGESVGLAICVGLSALVILGYSTPPIRATGKGFGELLLAAQIGYLTPTLGFLLQAGGPHRLLNLCTVALTLLLVAMLIALELPSYADDDRRQRATLLTTLGWERGLRLHHGLIFASYILLGLSVLLGFSFSLIGPAFLTLPFAILQVFLLQGIAHGARPIWRLMRANALAVFALTTYFLTLSFWIR